MATWTFFDKGEAKLKTEKIKRDISYETIVEEMEKAKLIPPGYNIVKKYEEFGMMRVDLYRDLNDGIQNFYDSIGMYFDPESKDLLYFARRDEFVVEKDQIKPKISWDQAEKIALDWYKEKQADKKSDIKEKYLNIVSIGLEPDYYILNEPKRYNDQYFLGYEFIFKDMDGIMDFVSVDAETGKVILEPDQANRTFTRIAGSDRIQTSIAVSMAQYFKGSKGVIIVNGFKDSDALAASKIAIEEDMPILLNGDKALDSRVKEEILRLKAEKIYIVGGEASIAKEVATDLEKLAKVERIAGPNRLRTGFEVWKKFHEDDNGSIIVNGNKNADALAAVNYLAQGDYDLILTDGKTIDKDYKLGQDRILIGGPKTMAIKVDNAKTMAGANRYETSLAIAKDLDQDPEILILVEGTAYADMLSAISLADDDSIILLVEKTPDKDVMAYIKKADEIIIVGGEDTLSYDFLK